MSHHQEQTIIQKQEESKVVDVDEQKELLLQMFLHAQNVRKFPAFATTKFGYEVAFTPTSKALVHLIGGIDRLRKMTAIFYKKFNNDRYLRQFLGRLQVPLEVHANRLALYIFEQLTGDQVWEDNMRSRPRHDIQLARGQTYQVTSRAGAHFCAWNSIDRPANLVGRRFKLDDCRVWMRLMFWAAREVGFVPPSSSTSSASPCAVPQLFIPTTSSSSSAGATASSSFTTSNPDEVFFVVFQNFISYFIAIYENTARPFARHEALWSSDERNIQNYLNSAIPNDDTTTTSSSPTSSLPFMRDVINVPYNVAIQQVKPENLITEDLFSVQVNVQK